MERRPWAEISLVIIGSILYFMANLQRVAVPGAMFDVLATDLQTTAQAVTALGSVFMYSYALGQLVIGVLIARYGGFRVVTVGSLLFFLGSLLFPFATALPVLYISRTLIGLGSASFYLGMINETRRLVHKKNFGVVLSLILFVGYLGGIIANAPLVICMKNLGWRDTFWLTAIVTTVLALLFICFNKFAKHVDVDRTVHMDLELFKSTFANKKNLNLYAFACFNYGLYYVLQTVIGKKFLEDFCLMPVMKSALILSVMGFMYAIAGSIIAFTSKAVLNRRTIFLKISSVNTLIVFGAILICVCLNVTPNISAPIVGIGFCTVSFGASLSPLLVPLLHDYNGSKVANTAISVMTCGFYIVVAVLGSVVGFCLDFFTVSTHRAYLTNSSAYIAIFGILFILAIFSFVNVFKIEESKKTLRLIEHINYIREHEQASPEDHWHDEYEHDLYTNV